jgi:hypothetical protein
LEAAVCGQRIGYVRVSTLDQNEKRQLDGVILDRLIVMLSSSLGSIGEKWTPWTTSLAIASPTT